MSTWVPVWDESFDRVTDEAAMYKAGFRVRAGYAGGGSKNKWLTASDIKAWFAQGPDTAIAPLFEIAGTEPIDNPASGVAHGRAARAAWRALGVPDSVAIGYAVDENVTMAQARDQLLRYFHNIHTGDGRTGIAYVELDAGAYLFSQGATAGTFTPAAFSWDPSSKLVTPANAPTHVVWTQEHNGRKLAGGTIDAGHIRTNAPVWWKTTTSHPSVPVAPPEEDMPLTKADLDLIFNDDRYRDLAFRASAVANLSPKFGGGTQLGQPVPFTTAIKAMLDPTALAAAIVAKLPTGSVDVATIKTALAEVLNDATVDLTVPAAG